MSAPILLTSIALLAAVAARPVNPERADDLADVQNSSGGQAFLGRLLPESFGSLNSLQLHDLHDTNGPDDALAGSASPRLKGAVPDPGLQSPYFGAQRHLSVVENTDLLPSPALSPGTPEPTSPAEVKESVVLEQQQPHGSPILVYLIASSMASLVLLGLAMVVVRVSQLYRETVLQSNVWQAIAGNKKGGLATSEKEKVGGRDSKLISGGGGDIAARNIPTESQLANLIEKHEEEEVIDDPADMPLPQSSAPALRENPRPLGLVVVLKAWTLDNWVTHFMVALFGWMGMLFRGQRQ